MVSGPSSAGVRELLWLAPQLAAGPPPGYLNQALMIGATLCGRGCRTAGDARSRRTARRSARVGSRNFPGKGGELRRGGSRSPPSWRATRWGAASGSRARPRRSSAGCGSCRWRRLATRERCCAQRVLRRSSSGACASSCTCSHRPASARAPCAGCAGALDSRGGWLLFSPRTPRARADAQDSFRRGLVGTDLLPAKENRSAELGNPCR